MNLLIKVTLIIFISGLALQSFSQDCKGTLIVNTNSEDASIYLNDEFAGEGKIETQLDAGVYTVVVKETDNIWGSRSLSKSVKINECNHQTLNFNFDDEIYLQTEPQDAAVYNEDSLIGYTPLHLAGMYGGLELRKPGYETKFISVENYHDETVPLDFTGEIRENSFYERDLFKYLLAGIVVLGGTTAYFKLKADKKFKEYEITGDQELLDETERYDLISGITFTALQINFGALIYFFLSD